MADTWHGLANCFEHPKADDLFDDDPEVRAKAITICDSCPVKWECLQEGFNDKERFGVRGGADPSRIREAQHIDPFGRPTSKKIEKTECLFCDAEIPLKGNKTQVVECHVCSMSWEVAFK